jgi:hypothetical protein
LPVPGPLGYAFFIPRQTFCLVPSANVTNFLKKKTFRPKSQTGRMRRRSPHVWHLERRAEPSRSLEKMTSLLTKKRLPIPHVAFLKH